MFPAIDDALSSTEVLSSKHSFFLNNPLFTVCLDLIAKKDEWFTAFETTLKDDFMIIALRDTPPHSVFDTDGFRLEEAHLRIDKKMASSKAFQKAVLSAAHYTAFYKNMHTSIEAHVYFNEFGQYLRTHVSEVDLKTNEKTERHISTELEDQLKENANTAQNMIVECSNVAQFYLREAMTQVKAKETLLEEKSVALIHNNIKGPYLEAADEFFTAIDYANTLRSEPLVLDKPVRSIVANLNATEVIFADLSESTDEEESDDDIPTLKSSDEKTKKRKNKTVNQTQLLSKIESLYSTFVDLKNKTDVSNVIQKSKMIDKIKHLLLIASIHKIQITDRKNIEKQCKAANINIETLFLEAVKNGDLVTIQALQEGVSQLQVYSYYYYYTIFRGITATLDPTTQTQYKKSCDYFYKNDPCYKTALHQFNSELILDTEKGIGFFPLFHIVLHKNDIIFDMFIEHECISPNMPGAILNQTFIPLLKTIALLKVPGKMDCMKKLLHAGVSVTLENKHLSRHFRMVKTSIKNKEKTVVSAREKKSDFREMGKASGDMFDFIETAIHAHSGLQLLCFLNEKNLHEIDDHCFEISNFDLVTLIHALATLIEYPEYAAAQCIDTDQEPFHFHHGDREEMTRYFSQLRSRAHSNVDNASIRVSMLFSPAPIVPASQIRFFENLVRHINLLLEGKTDKERDAFILKTIEKTKAFYPDPESMRHTVSNHFLKFNTYAQLMLFILLKNKTVDHLLQIMQLNLDLAALCKNPADAKSMLGKVLEFSIYSEMPGYSKAHKERVSIAQQKLQKLNTPSTSMSNIDLSELLKAHPELLKQFMQKPQNQGTTQGSSSSTPYPTQASSSSHASQDKKGNGKKGRH